MVNRKREPWWNRKSEVSAATAAAVSRRSKFLSGQRVSTNSVTSDVIEGEVGTTPTNDSDQSVLQAKFGDVNDNCDKDTNEYDTQVSESVVVVDAANDDGESIDVTPTRDEHPVWEIVDNTNDDIDNGNSTNNLASTKGIVPYDTDNDKGDTDDVSSAQQDSDNGSGSKQTTLGSKDKVGNVRTPEFYGPPEPCSSLSSLQTWDNDLSTYSVISNVDDDYIHEQRERSAYDLRKQRKRRKTDRHGSVESDKSTNTLSSDKSSTKDQTSSCYQDKHSSRSKEYKLTKKHSKKCKDDSEDKAGGSPRRPRTLTVAYDKIRQQNGTALPVRTYDPLDPLGMRSKYWSSAKTKPYTQRYKSSQKHGSSSSRHNTSSAHHRHRSTSTERSKRSSSEKSIESSHRTERARSSSQDLSLSSQSGTSLHQHRYKFSDKFNKDKSSSSTGNKFFSKHVSSSSSSSRHSSKYVRAKSVYSSHVKRSSVKKSDKPVEASKWMKLNSDGIGIQKIRPNQRKTFMATCVEEYSLQTNGSMAKDVKPLLAFKIGNPQFVSEFYEKKTELNDLPVTDGMLVTKIMKEKFAFKVKIGIDKLDKFITEGITVSGQNSFFSQFRHAPTASNNNGNAVLLYRYADVCLAWTSSKNIAKSTPIFLLIHKVVYGRSKTYHHLGEASYIKEDHHCDCLKASLSAMRRKDADDNEIRKGLACSKVILADFDPVTGKHRERPRQILPYAIVLYARTSLSETEQADLKQSVLEWKKKFELHRWNMATAELNNKQRIMQQQQQLVHHSGLLSPPENMVPSQVPWQGMGSNSPSMMSSAPPGAGFMPPPAGMEATGLMPPPGLPNCSIMPPPYIENHHMQPSNMENIVFDPSAMPPNVDDLQSSNFITDNQPPMEEESSSRKRRRSRSNSSIESGERLASKTPVDAELDRMVSQALSSHRRSLETKDVGIQVKTQSTIISLQKKNVSLSASTQTPDLDTEDSYEAMLLRGKPLEPPTCVHCKSKMDAKGAVMSEKEKGRVLTKVFLNRNDRPRQFKSLSQRFAKADAVPDDMDDMLLDENFDSN